MSRFIEIRKGVVVNVDHIVMTGYSNSGCGFGAPAFIVYISNGHEVEIDTKNIPGFTQKLLTNQSDQSTIKVNQGSNQPEKGKKNVI